MKAGPATNRRKRILVFYSLAMLIPGLVLGYLAYRGILNDQALREKQARQKMESVARDFFVNLDSLFNRQVKSCLALASGVCDPDVLLFYSDSAGRGKRILRHQLLYLPPDQLDPPAMSETHTDLWIKGWELESDNANLNDAFDFYQGIAQSDTHPGSKLKAMVAMARILNKQGKSDEAIELYREISQSYPSHKLNGQIPAKALALSEIAGIYHGKQDTTAVKSAVDELINCLIDPQARYDKAHYQFFKAKAAEFNYATISDSLWNDLNQKQLQTDQLLRIFTESDRLGSNPMNSPSQRNFIFEDKFKVANFNTYKASGEEFGLVLDLFPWMEDHQEEIFSTLREEEGDLYWKMSGHDALSRFTADEKKEAEWLTFSFPDNLPPWKLQLAPKNMSWLATIFQPGNGVFVLIFGFIILIMVTGLAFTVHILNQELRLNKLKTEFISNVSHELKSPLTSIRQMTEMLHEKRMDSEEQRDDYYSIMLDQSEHLSHLIDNILDFSRMEEHRKLYHFERLDLVTEIEKMTGNFRRQFAEGGYEFQLKCNADQILIRADKEAIRQVFYNLMDNAIKYSGRSRKIEIALDLKGRGQTGEGRRQKAEGRNQEEDLRLKKEGEICLSIRDWGIGIEKKDLDKIFERFYRSGESQKLGIKGSGIGLTLVKGIVEAHQGRVAVEIQPGEGTIFYIYIPVYKEDIDEKDAVD